MLESDSKPTLILAVGNPSRGDDALAPRLLELISADINEQTVELLTDFQLQIEHALDLVGRQRVLFIDAAVNCEQAFAFSEQQAASDYAHTSHIMSPAAIMAVFRSITAQSPPPCFLLNIQGQSFELGDSLSEAAEQNLEAARLFMLTAVETADVEGWRCLIEQSK